MLSKETENYSQILAELKAVVRESRQKAILSANAHLLNLYWEIGQTISEQVRQADWGAKTIEKLANDLRSEFPDIVLLP